MKAWEQRVLLLPLCLCVDAYQCCLAHAVHMLSTIFEEKKLQLKGTTSPKNHKIKAT